MTPAQQLERVVFGDLPQPLCPVESAPSFLLSSQVIGLQQAVSALFDRYDFDGTGTVVTEQFVAMILQCVPDCGGAPEVRNGFAVIRRAVRAAGGLHGLRRFIHILERRAHRGVLRRLDVVEALTVEMGAHVKEADYRPVFAAYDTDKTELLSLQELAFGLRGALPRGRRVIAERAWQQLLLRCGEEGASAISVGSLLANVDRSCAAFSQPVRAAWMPSAGAGRGCCGAAGAHAVSHVTPLSPLQLSLHSHRSHGATGAPGGSDPADGGIEAALGSLSEVGFADWLDYCKDLSAVLPRDSEFCALFGEAFGADTRLERASLVKPGSIEDLLRSGRGAHGVPDASATGRRPVEGLLGGSHAADTRFALSSSSRLAASLGGRGTDLPGEGGDAVLSSGSPSRRPMSAMASLTATGAEFGAGAARPGTALPYSSSAAGRPMRSAAFGQAVGSGSDASALSAGPDKARPQTAGPRAVLAPQLAFSLTRGTLRL